MKTKVSKVGEERDDGVRRARETVGKKQYAHSAADLSRMIQFLPRRRKQKGFRRRESQPRVQEYI